MFLLVKHFTAASNLTLQIKRNFRYFSSVNLNMRQEAFFPASTSDTEAFAPHATTLSLSISPN